ncbi:MAG: hypothetical protein OXG85_03215 [Chloroflexi bacterium]|nr:hypothetical protein [Chloroflexota bacterium]
MDKTKAAPRRLLGSRRFWSSIISVITLIIAASRPELEEHLDVLAPTITTICVTLVGGYIIEDREPAKNAGLNGKDDRHESNAA